MLNVVLHCQLGSQSMLHALWRPSQQDIVQTRLSDFMQAVNQRYAKHFKLYHELHTWSIQNREDFWSFWAEYSHFPFITASSTVLQSGHLMKESRWFPSAQVNYAKKFFDYQEQQTAIIAYQENGNRKKISKKQLTEQIMIASSKLKALNIQSGDRVVGYMPNTIETIIMLLACASIGAIWSSCSTDFGAQSVLYRFTQIQPKLLLTVNGYQYAGKQHCIFNKIKTIIEKISSIETCIMVDFLENKSNFEGCTIKNAKVISWARFLGDTYNNNDFEMTALPFNHPLYILYSSGTTGPPKCIVHGHGGSLLQHLKEHQLHTNIREMDRVFYYTTCGWMMWNWLVSVLASGASIVLYEGSPFFEGPHALWNLIDKEKVSVFGTSAKYIHALMQHEYCPKKYHNLTSLKTILSTGSPLLPDDFRFVYQDIKSNVCLSSISGGTDIVSCFALGNPMLPVYEGQIQCLGLGMDVQFLDGHGQSVTAAKGELACVQSFPSMPVYFWNDPTEEKYHNAYFNRFKNIWMHGDYGEITEEQGVILYGRSDNTLNPGGVRIGPAEIYQHLRSIAVIQDALAVGQAWHNDERILLFIILRDDVPFTDELGQKIKQTIRHHASPRHVPDQVISVHDFPRTYNGKVSETAVKAIMNGHSIDNRAALINPEVLIRVPKNCITDVRAQVNRVRR